MADASGSVAEIAEAVAAGSLRASDALAAHVASWQSTHARLNALVQPRHDEAAAEASRIAPGCAGPLAGVPLTVKECFPVRGLVTTLGIESRRQARDEATAWLVERLQAAGAVVVGKDNVPQAMYLHETDNPVWGRTNHPHAADRGPGGSSGGAAAVVAAGVVPLSLGNDLAGSIRQPAHACGIAGIMPRSTVLGEGGAFDTMPHLKVVRPRAGFLARSVDDLSRALGAVGVETSPSERGGPLRIAWWDDAGPLDPSPAVRRAVREAVGRLQAAGAVARECDGGIARDAAWLHLAILSADGGADVRRLFAGSRPIWPVARLLRLAGVPRAARPWLAALVRATGRQIEAEGLLATGPRRGAGFEQLLHERARIATRVAALAADYDAIVCPVSALPALRHGTAAKLIVAAAPCLLANLLDLAAGTVPVTTVRPGEETGRGRSRDPVVRAAIECDRGSAGLPVGVQVIALTGGEATAIEVMRLIEAK
ncbi:MAG: amidase family protein [Planctomycetia bacterium]